MRRIIRHAWIDSFHQIATIVVTPFDIVHSVACMRICDSIVDELR
jgi:hypothetical protein